MINSNLLKTVIFSSLILSPSFSVAENLVGLSYTANAKGKKIESYQFDDSDILKLDYFKINHEGKKLGYYFSVGTSIDDGNLHYDYTLINVGLTRPIGNSAFVFLGGGYSWEVAEFYNSYGTIYESIDNNNGFNANVGLGYKLGKFGITIAYDTAPQSIGIGFVRSF